MNAATQEIVALALVVLIAGFALWRRLNKPENGGCGSCEKNAANKPGTTEQSGPKETVLRFMPKPRDKS